MSVGKQCSSRSAKSSASSLPLSASRKRSATSFGENSTCGIMLTIFHVIRHFVASQATDQTERVGLRALAFMNRTCSRLPSPTNYTASITGGGVRPQIAGGSLFRAAASAIVMR